MQLRIRRHGKIASAAVLSAALATASAQTPDAAKQADAAFRAGYAARQAGQLNAARADFAKVVRLAPGIPEGHVALGAVLLELGQPAEAIPEFEAAAKLKPMILIRNRTS